MINNKERLIKASDTTYLDRDLVKINFIGDPGCDGLGAGIMSVFARALTADSADISLIVGDMVPFGSRQIYQNFTDFTNSMAGNPVYTLKGNHDTEFFTEFFGSPNYAIVANNLLIVVLDNAARVFTPEALVFSRKILNEVSRENIIFAFHYPPPNPKASNSINYPDWESFRSIYNPFLNKIRYFISGHVHSLVESSIDGIPVIITGGAGARIESVNKEVDETYIRHHIVQLYTDNSGVFKHKYIFLDNILYDKELKDSLLKEKLDHAFKNEIFAHFKYRLMAQNAREQGWHGLSKLFTALSDSEFYHASNHFSVLNRNKSILNDLNTSIDNETWEVEHMYRDYADYSRGKGHSLSLYTFRDALNAEKTHKNLLQKALAFVEAEKDIPLVNYYTCTSCGYTFETANPPDRCPVCGAPKDKIIPVL